MTPHPFLEIIPFVDEDDGVACPKNIFLGVDQMLQYIYFLSRNG